MRKLELVFRSVEFVVAFAESNLEIVLNQSARTKDLTLTFESRHVPSSRDKANPGFGKELR